MKWVLVVRHMGLGPELAALDLRSAGPFPEDCLEDVARICIEDYSADMVHVWDAEPDLDDVRAHVQAGHAIAAHPQSKKLILSKRVAELIRKNAEGQA